MNPCEDLKPGDLDMPQQPFEWPYVVPLPQGNMDNGPSLFNYELDDLYDDLIDNFDPYLEYGKGYQNRTGFEDAFYG